MRMPAWGLNFGSTTQVYYLTYTARDPFVLAAPQVVDRGAVPVSAIGHSGGTDTNDDEAFYELAKPVMAAYAKACSLMGGAGAGFVTALLRHVERLFEQAGGLQARVDEDVPGGIRGDAGSLPQIHMFGQLQQIGHRIKGNGRRCFLGERHGGDERKQNG